MRRRRLIIMLCVLVSAALLCGTAYAAGGIFNSNHGKGDINLLKETDGTELKNADAGFSKDLPNAVELPDFANYNCEFTVGNELDYISIDNLSPAEIVLAESLQGIVAKSKVQIYLYNSNHKEWFDFLQTEYGIKMNKLNGLWELVEKYKSYIKDSGYVTYTAYDTKETLENQQSINSACTIAGIENWLVVEKSLESAAQSRGFQKKVDGTYELTIFDKYSASGKLSKSFAVSAAYGIVSLRDFGIAVGAMFYYEDYRQGFSDVVGYLDNNAMLLGWLRDEPRDVSICSSLGVMVEPSDWVENLSVFAAVGKGNYTKAKDVARYEVKDRTDVHYIAFMMSDGDNLSYLQGAITEEKFYGSSLRGEIPIGWFLSTATATLAPAYARYYYRNATNNDAFMAPLGAGYIHTSAYPKDEFPKYAALTAAWMNLNNLEYVLLADETINALTGSLWEDKYSYILEEMAKYPNIKGGLLSYGTAYVPRTQGENGGVKWVNDKPFITNKDVLWSATGNSHPSDQEIAEAAYKINQYERDSTKIEGYSIFTVHAWSWGYEDVVNLVSMLDDDVVVVTPVELFELISKNVPHRDVRKPDVEKYNNLDYSGVKPFVSKSFIDINCLNEMNASTQTVFDFSSNGTQGWVPVAMDGNYDAAKLEIWGNKKVLYMNGYNGTVVKNTPNSYFMNKLALRTSDSRLRVSLQSGSARLKVQILESSGVLHTVSDDWETLTPSGSYYTKEYDISEFSGKEVAVLLEQSSVDTAFGNHIIIDKIEII